MHSHKAKQTYRSSSTFQLWHSKYLTPDASKAAVRGSNALLPLSVLCAGALLLTSGTAQTVTARKCQVGIDSLPRATLLELQMKSHGHSWPGQDDQGTNLVSAAVELHCQMQGNKRTKTEVPQSQAQPSFRRPTEKQQGS